MQIRFSRILRNLCFIVAACTGTALWATPPAGLSLVISPLADDPNAFRLDVSGTGSTVSDDLAQAGSLTFSHSPDAPFGDYGANPASNLVFAGQSIEYFGTQGSDMFFFVFSVTGSVDAGSSYSFDTDYALGTASSGYEATFIPGTYTILSGSGIFGSDAVGSLIIRDTPIGTPVPEPATYAALAGVAVLGFGVWRRRRAA